MGINQNYDRHLGIRQGREHPNYYDELLACWSCGYDPAYHRDDFDIVLCQNCYDEMKDKEENDSIQRTD